MCLPPQEARQCEVAGACFRLVDRDIVAYGFGWVRECSSALSATVLPRQSTHGFNKSLH
jgi:hypothetical protein